jgi:MFS family permease
MNPPAAGSVTRPQPTHDPYAPLRVPAFLLFLAGSMLATIASEMQTVAIGWELYERTNSPLALGLVGFVQILPVLGLTLLAGVLADRWPRIRILQATLLIQAVCSLSLAIASTGRFPVPFLYACLALNGIALAFAFPARGSIVPQLVPFQMLASAIAWRTSGWQSAACLGPALGGLLLATARIPAVVYACAAALALGVCLAWLRLQAAPQDELPRSAFNWRSLLAGAQFVANHKLILAALTLDLFAILLGGATALLPIFSRDILKVGPSGLGWLRAAPSLGALAMALLIAHRPPFQHAGRTLIAAVAGFGLATIAFGASRSFLLSLLLLATLGALDNISVVIRATLVQSLTPDSMRGRVAAINSVFVCMSNELGSLESGLAAWLLGPVPAVVLGGLGCLVVVLVVAIRWPELPRLGRIDQLQPLPLPARTQAAPSPP